jgi:hypothetical protein
MASDRLALACLLIPSSKMGVSCSAILRILVESRVIYCVRWCRRPSAAAALAAKEVWGRTPSTAAAPSQAKR